MKQIETDEEFDIDIDVPFDNGQLYVIGYDTFGYGIAFDQRISVCSSKEELNDEAHRIIYENNLEQQLDHSTINEILCIAQIINPKIKFEQYEVTIIKKRK